MDGHVKLYKISQIVDTDNVAPAAKFPAGSFKRNFWDPFAP